MQMPEVSDTLETGLGNDRKSYCKDVRKRLIPTKLTCTYIFLGLIAFFFAINLTYGNFPKNAFTLGYFLKTSNVPQQCLDPATRREWRSFSQNEKKEYIRAVKCLKSRPSRVRRSGKLYDDFPYIHSRIGGYSHGAAPFLAWHRYLLHIYEKMLKEQCDYSGSLGYWDWSLDWENLTNSPVFDPYTGFGGNGDRSGTVSVGGGHCVTDGPFADLTLPFFNGNDHLHCLSRGFQDGNISGSLPGKKVQPKAIEKLFKERDYEGFMLALERGPHNEIPNGIRGDFIKFTAPNDPLFFLHHGQLDRLWWLWQQADRLARTDQYAGLAAHNSKVRASKHDILPMGGLADNVTVSEVLETESAILCYRY